MHQALRTQCTGADILHGAKSYRKTTWMIFSRNKSKEWSITYSPYVDTLHVFRHSINTIPKRNLIDKDCGAFFVILNSSTHRPVLFEMKQASKSFGDIDNMNKELIIKKVNEMVKNHGRAE